MRISERAKKRFGIREAKLNCQRLVAETEQVGKRFIERHSISFRFKVSGFKFGPQSRLLNCISCIWRT